jgi:hypothetical protein
MRSGNGLPVARNGGQVSGKTMGKAWRPFPYLLIGEYA